MTTASGTSFPDWGKPEPRRRSSRSCRRAASDMPWLDLLSYVFGGALLANAVPHMVSGVMGRPFQSPFAKPPGQGLSSSTVNVLWGFLNIVIGFLLIVHVGA